jgi:DNA-binding response OmpR family regulator
MGTISTLNPPPNDGSGRSIVLVVDHDDVQLDSICRGALIYGHECIKLSSVSEAIDFLNRPSRPRIDILITDITTEGSAGFDLIRHARALYPRLPIIAVCGLASSEEIEVVRDAGVLILRRPFLPQGLDGAIRDSVA